MSDQNYSTYGPPLSTEDRRSHREGAAKMPLRRINDTLFNRARWPVFVYSWFALGALLLMYWIFRLMVE